MFGKFVKFWIENKNLTLLFMIITLLSGVFSWFTISKQYNPDIIVPAFSIIVPAPGFSAQEVENLVVNPLEDKLWEIKGVEHVYGIANQDFGAVMVSFYVGTDKEKATTRLYDKIFSKEDEKPIGVQDPIIQKIDPDDLPIYTFALVDESNKNKDSFVKLKKTANDIIEQVKLIDNTSVLQIVGGEKDNINIELDLNKLEAKNIDIMQVYEAIRKNNISFPGGTYNIGNIQNKISIDGNLNSIEKIKKLIIATYNNSPIYLEDIANIYRGASQKKYSTFEKYENNPIKNAVFIGIAKKKGTNAVFVAEDIVKKLEVIKKQLPENYSIVEIQNEGKTAEKATNMLLINLIESIVIVIIVLTLTLGFRNALNTAISIPLTLSVVFLFSYTIGDNVNRISLFALILVLGMLVDNATVVVENINTHLNNRFENSKTKLDAVLDAVKEVKLGVILSTITRLLAFGSMFFVTGIMGEYMGPIPKYAIVALITSTVIALSINPFLSYIVIKDNKPPKKKKTKKKEGNMYLKVMGMFVGDKSRQKFKRIFVKFVFWTLLGAITLLPVGLQIFKGRMLPKSDQDQVYIWLESSRSSNIDRIEDITKDVNTFIEKYTYSENNNSELNIIKGVSYWLGLAPMGDFANLFRGASMRNGENYISMRVNLIPASNRDIKSEEFVIKLRPIFRKYMLEKYPKLKIRLLEDPPGPPVRSTFMLKVSSEQGENYENIEKISSFLEAKLKPFFAANNIEDVATTKDSYKTNYKLKFNHELVSRLGLNMEQISYTIYNIFEGTNISVYHDKNMKEAVNIYLSVNKLEKNRQDILKKISFTNPQGKKVPLNEIAKILPTEKDKIIYSDDRLPTVYIYGEMGDNSVIYPMIKLFGMFLKDNFWGDNFEVSKWDLYGFEIKDKASGKYYFVNFGGEWKLSMDTFRDLGLAMLIALLAIYFMMVAQFKSFRIGGNIMITFLLGLFGIMPLFTGLFLFDNQYFSATSMIGVIALAGIVVGNAIIYIEYLNILLDDGHGLRYSILEAGSRRLKPIIITSLTTIFGATTILGDPVWSGLARSIIGGLIASASLTLFIIPIFLYDTLKKVRPELE